MAVVVSHNVLMVQVLENVSEGRGQHSEASARAAGSHFGDDLLSVSLRHALKVELFPRKYLPAEIHKNAVL